MNEKYNVIIVDDEYLAQKLLQDYVSKVEQLQLVATCSNAFEAMEALKSNAVDIMLLDIQMPDLTGLELVKSLDKKPAVIFTTAYSEYAVDAFNLAVSDYLLKPFNFPRFFQAINKAIGQVPPRTENAPKPAADTISRSNDFITVKADYKLYKINYDDLLYIEGQHEAAHHGPCCLEGLRGDAAQGAICACPQVVYRLVQAHSGLGQERRYGDGQQDSRGGQLSR